MHAVRAAAFTVGAACLVALVFVSEQPTSTVLAVIAGAMFVVLAWACGAFDRETWISDDPEYGRIDQELDEQERGRR